jgi:hypothetical protein
VDETIEKQEAQIEKLQDLKKAIATTRRFQCSDLKTLTFKEQAEKAKAGSNFEDALYTGPRK